MDLAVESQIAFADGDLSFAQTAAKEKEDETEPEAETEKPKRKRAPSKKAAAKVGIPWIGSYRYV